MKKNISSASRSQNAFSLVEVVVSLGIVSFALLAIVALLPIGLQSTKDTIEETNAVNALSAIIADRQATPFNTKSVVYQLPVLTNGMPLQSNYFGITDNNQSTGATLTQAHYRVDYVVIPPVAGQLDPYQIHFKVSWPAPNTNSAGSVEVVATYPQP